MIWGRLDFVRVKLSQKPTRSRVWSIIYTYIMLRTREAY